MTILYVILIIAAIGVVVGLINKYGGEYIAGGFLKLLNIVAIVGVIIWLIFGVLAVPLPDITMPKFNR